MLTKVILEGPMGKKFGREWELAVSSAHEALRLIDANKPGLFAWIKQNLDKYSKYQVVCEYDDGRVEELDNDDYVLERMPTHIRFVPLIEGASAAARIVAGVVLVVVGYLLSPYTGGASLSLVGYGMSLIVGGITELLTKSPKNETTERKDKTSYYFNGPVNTTTQGVPVQLIYGRRVMCGSHVISSRLSIDQTGEE